MICRHCKSDLRDVFVDLISAPPSNAFLTPDGLAQPEAWYPLKAFVCRTCFLVQLPVHKPADEIFDDSYAYFSSYSRTWLRHAADYVDHIVSRLHLDATSSVVEIASNDGYLLKNFVARGIPCIGIEPSANTAAAARSQGVETLVDFFTQTLARKFVAEGRSADLIIGNNVLAHVPDINDFTLGLSTALKPQGVVTLEFPHLMQLIEHNQFDTIYHEHFSYLSLLVVTRIFKAAGLRIFDVKELPTHGGSLRVYGCRSGADHVQTSEVGRILEDERRAGLNTLAPYLTLQCRAEVAKDALLCFLIDVKRKGQRIAAYGAAAKGNTMLNFAGIKPDLLPFVCDAAPSKQGHFLPGSHIPILPPAALTDFRPEYVLILPWNIADEIIAQLAPLAAQGTRFVTAVPDLRVR